MKDNPRNIYLVNKCIVDNYARSIGKEYLDNKLHFSKRHETLPEYITRIKPENIVSVRNSHDFSWVMRFRSKASFFEFVLRYSN